METVLDLNNFQEVLNIQPLRLRVLNFLLQIRKQSCSLAVLSSIQTKQLPVDLFLHVSALQTVASWPVEQVDLQESAIQESAIRLALRAPRSCIAL